MSQDLSPSEVNDHHNLLKLQNDPSNTTVLIISNHVRDMWKSLSGTLIRIEILVSLAAVFYLFLIIFGSQRRRRRNWFIQKGVLGAYTLSFSLVSYILGSMQSSAVKSSMYPIWALSLYTLHGCTDSITAYSLHDNTRSTTQLYQAFLYSAYVIFLLISVLSSNASAILAIPLFCFVYSIAHIRFGQRVGAWDLASQSWNLNKVIADYMYDEHNRGAFVPATMEGCHYLVDWPLSKSKLDPLSYATQLKADAGEVIDIEKIWLCKDKSLSPELKDVCLSFSLFQLLKRRHFGFDFGESKERAHDFVFKGLLLENDDGDTDYNRVFKVIEVELAFMYDFFFTKYAAIYYASRATTILSLLSFASCMSLAAYEIAMRAEENSYIQDNSAVMSATTADVVIVFLILACTGFLQLLQLLLYWTSIWARVSFVCQYLREQAIWNRRRSCCIMRLKEFLAKIGVYYESNKQYWLHKLGQYSLFESVSYNRNPSEKKFMQRLGVTLNKFFEKFMTRTLFILDDTSIHPRSDYAFKVRGEPGIPIKLPAQVKEAFVHSLKRTDGKLTNGESSLKSNGADHLLWTCSRGMHLGTSWSKRMENQTHLILTWHIATCYCEMARTKYPCSNEGKELKFHVEVATKLSKYCAYLVVFAPRFLPGHYYDTTHVFDAVAEEAYKFFASSPDKCEAMRNLAETEELDESKKTVLQRGAKLGKQLEEMPEGTHWKVMADFWAEMLLYVAPSDNVKEHIEQLAQGGEFITHLWALLSHAGILERDQQNPDYPRAENTQSSVGHQPARYATLVPASPLGGSVLQAPSSPGANERRIDIAEV